VFQTPEVDDEELERELGLASDLPNDKELFKQLGIPVEESDIDVDALINQLAKSNVGAEIASDPEMDDLKRRFELLRH
jgi:hypothetical protein